MAERGRSPLHLLLGILLPLALSSTIYLYLYPLFNGCAFPYANATQTDAWRATLAQHLPVTASSAVGTAFQAPPFRLLVLADPQLEGDSSLPHSQSGFFQRLDRHWENIFDRRRSERQWHHAIQQALKELINVDVPDLLYGLRKRLDLLGNDYYLAHIFRTLHWWSRPTHVTVLGDLLGSQWVTDEEFDTRARRYWRRVFAGGQRVDHDEAVDAAHEPVSGAAGLEDQVLGEHRWENRVINVAGNHDIGYAGEVSRARLARFEKNFGRADWDIRFHLPRLDGHTNDSSSPAPSLHVIVLNDLVLDTPALDTDIQSDAYDYLNSIITHRSHPVEDETSFSLLLTHVPLHKPQGVCVDAPLFNFHDSDHRSQNQDDFKPGGLKEQNHLSDHVSQSGILQSLYGMSADPRAPAHGMGRRGLILTGHDHEGCDTWHHIPAHTPDEIDNTADGSQSQGPRGWQSIPWADANVTASHTGVREITVRSMMGGLGGNAGLLSLWFDPETNRWRYEMQMCPFGVQHIWWAVHGLDIVTLGLGLLGLLGPLRHLLSRGRRSESTNLDKEDPAGPGVLGAGKGRREGKSGTSTSSKGKAARHGHVTIKR